MLVIGLLAFSAEAKKPSIHRNMGAYSEQTPLVVSSSPANQLEMEGSPKDQNLSATHHNDGKQLPP